MHKSTDKIEFYEERAAAAAEDARDATLQNVRELALRSQAVWRQMADRAIAVEEAKARKISEVNRPDDTE